MRMRRRDAGTGSRSPWYGRIGFALVGLLGALEPRVALLFTAVRVVALLSTPLAPRTVAPLLRLDTWGGHGSVSR